MSVSDWDDDQDLALPLMGEPVLEEDALEPVDEDYTLIGDFIEPNDDEDIIFGGPLSPGRLERLPDKLLKVFLELADPAEVGWALDALDVVSQQRCREFLSGSDLVVFEAAVDGRSQPPAGFSAYEVMLTLEGILIGRLEDLLQKLAISTRSKEVLVTHVDGRLIAPRTSALWAQSGARWPAISDLLSHQLRFWGLQGAKECLSIYPLNATHILWLTGESAEGLGRVRHFLSIYHDALVEELLAFQD